jgi:hypothetical protein
VIAQVHAKTLLVPSTKVKSRIMAAQINNSFQVAEAELAYLVLNYLEEKGWKKTVGSMKR